MEIKDYEALKNSSEYKTARIVEDAINNMAFDPELFAQAFTTWHRTLQQKFFRVVVETIKVAASEDYMYDGRNKATHELAEKIVKTGALDHPYLPCI